MKKVSKLIKLVHSELSDCLAEFPAMMWIALFLDCLLVLYMLLLGIDSILFPSRMTTLRMVIGGYGVVNAIFFLIAAYILLFAIVGLIFGWMAVAYALFSMFALGTVFYVLVILEEEPWKYANTTENMFGYALMAYCVVFLFIPIIVLNILSDMRDEGKISTKWM